MVMQEDIETTTKRKPLKILYRLFSYGRGHRRYFFGALFCITFLQLLNVLGPKLLGLAINGIETDLANGTNTNQQNLIYWAFAFVAVAFIRYIDAVAYHWNGANNAHRTVRELRVDLFRAIQALSFKNKNEVSAGQIIARSTGDIRNVTTAFGHLLFTSIALVGYIVGAFIMIALIDFKLALIAFCTVPITAYAINRIAVHLRSLWKKQREKMDTLSEVIKENVAGVRVTKAFAREDARKSIFQTAVKESFDASIVIVKTLSRGMPIIFSLFDTLIPIIIIIGGMRVINEASLKTGDLAQVLLYVTSLKQRMRLIGNLTNASERAIMGGERIFEIIDKQQDVCESENAVDLTSGNGECIFENVSFQYDDTKSILKNISVKIPSGSTVGIIGQTGSGKSTMMSLLTRFYDPQKGRVLIDGQDVKDLTLSSLRNSIGLVFQETFLFSDTVSANIALNKQSISEEEIIQCAKNAQAHNFITELKDGYEQELGERGVTLSGGQRQRLAIARAFAKKPRILILDDATASVDPKTDRLIRDTIKEIHNKQTIFIISQRIATIADADIILVIDNGEIAQSGTHTELTSKDGIYKNIVSSQYEDKAGE